MVSLDDADDTDDDGRRILINRKGNYSKTGTRIELRWEQWRYVNTSPGIATAPGGVSASTAAMKAARQAEAEQAFLDMPGESCPTQGECLPEPQFRQLCAEAIQQDAARKPVRTEGAHRGDGRLAREQGDSTEQYGRPAQTSHRLVIVKPAAKPSVENTEK